MSIDLGLTPRQEELREQARAIAARRAGPDRKLARGTDDAVAPELAADLEAGGLAVLAVPAEHGGGGAGLVEAAIVCEELARGAPGLAVAYADSVVAGGWALARHGSGAGQRALLGQLVRGEARFAAALAEVDARVAIEATPGGEWLLSGEWAGIGGAHVADYLLVLANAEPAGAGGGGPVLVYVRSRQPGVIAAALGQPAATAVPTCEVRFDRARAGRDALLGEPGQAASIAVDLLEVRRLLLAAVSTGLAQQAFESALARARESRAGEPPPGSAQATQHALAAAHTRIEAARLLVYHGAWCADAGQSLTPHGALARHYAADAAHLAATVGMRILGPRADQAECEMQRCLRGAVPLELAAGGREADRDVIARSFGL